MRTGTLVWVLVMVGVDLVRAGVRDTDENGRERTTDVSLSKTADLGVTTGDVTLSTVRTGLSKHGWSVTDYVAPAEQPGVVAEARVAGEPVRTPAQVEAARAAGTPTTASPGKAGAAHNGG